MNKHFSTAFGAKKTTGSHYQSRYTQQKQAAEQERKEKEKLEVNDINYPSLGEGWTPTAPAPKQTLHYASLAADWDARSNADKEQEARKRAAAERREYELWQIRERRRHVGITQSRTEDTHEECYEDDISPPKEDDGWTTVERKTFKAKKDITLEAEADENPEEESVWCDEDEPVYLHPKEKGAIW